MNYDLVFDAANNTYTIWESLRLGLLVIAFGIALNVNPTLRSLLTKKLPEKFSKLIAKFALGLAIFYTVMSFGSYTDHNRAKSASQENSCTIVEGRIENYQLYNAKKIEKFEVRGVTFSYSDYERTGGFNNTAPQGGPISEGRNARICYISPKYKKSHIIVRLELEK